MTGNNIVFRNTWINVTVYKITVEAENNTSRDFKGN
jgi:hypothetical protein